MSNVQRAFTEDEISRFNADYVGHVDLVFQTVFGVCLSHSKSMEFTYATYAHLAANMAKSLAQTNPKLHCLSVLSQILLADTQQIAPANKDRNRLLASFEKNTRLIIVLVDFAATLVEEAALAVEMDTAKVRNLLAGAREKLTN